MLQTYLGCYYDSSNNRLLSHRINGDNHTEQSCRQSCSSYKYFGLQYMGECRCGNSIANAQKVSEGQCNTKCRKDTRQTCGGPYRNSLHKV